MVLQLDFRGKNDYKTTRKSITEFLAPASITLKFDDNGIPCFLSYGNNKDNALDLLPKNEEIYQILVDGSCIWCDNSCYIRPRYYNTMNPQYYTVDVDMSKTATIEEE